MLSIVQAATTEHISQVQGLFIEYVEFIRTEVDADQEDLNDVPPMAGIQEEMAGLPGRYAPPDGRLLLAQIDGAAVGCVAFHKISDSVCELKRMWVRPAFRGQRVGRTLVETLIGEARHVGYREMILDTDDTLKEAQSLYRSFGFELTTPFFEAAPEIMVRTIFMKLDLTAPPKTG